MRKKQYPLLDYAARNWHAHIRRKDDIDGPSRKILTRLIEPGSPLLLSWGAAAGIPDFQVARDSFEVAMKANITWLVELLSSEMTITEEKVRELAKNLATGYTVMEALINKDDVVFSPEAILTVASDFNQGMMKLLLNNNNDIEVTTALIKAAAGNQRSGGYVIRLLLERRSDTVLTAELVQATAENKESGRDVIELLLQKCIQITECAVEEIARRFDGNVMTFVLGQRGQDMQITDTVVEEVARRFDGKVMTLLLEQRGQDV